MMMSRRGILGGLASMLAAPAIVHAGNLMPVKALATEPPNIHELISRAYKITREAIDQNLYRSLYGEWRFLGYDAIRVFCDEKDDIVSPT